MEQLNILATKLRNCITNFFTQAEAVGVKGNIYLFLEGEELSFSISELQGTSDFEKPLKEKKLGGYYDQVRITLPEGGARQKLQHVYRFLFRHMC